VRAAAGTRTELCSNPQPPRWEKKGNKEKKGRRPHPAEEAAIGRLHSGAHQAQAAGRLVERLAHHRARVVHQHHVPDLRTAPGSGARRARAQPRAASGVSRASLGVPGPRSARTRTSVSARLGRRARGSTCRANTFAAPSVCAFRPRRPEREKRDLAPGARGPQTCEDGPARESGRAGHSPTRAPDQPQPPHWSRVWRAAHQGRGLTREAVESTATACCPSWGPRTPGAYGNTGRPRAQRVRQQA